MAISEDNIITAGLRGKVGNLVFRKRGKKTTVYVLSARKKPLSEKQKKAQQQFARAVALAKQALANESEYKRFREMAESQGKESAYSAAVAYFMDREK